MSQPPPSSFPDVPGEPLLRVRGLTKRYGAFTALSGVSFAVHVGEVLGLIGPNGSGKTTLFECLGGVLPFDQGSLSSLGQPVTLAGRPDLLFYLPDSIVPWPSQRVGWLLEYVAGLFGGTVSRRESVIRQLALEGLLDSRMGSLSKGQRKRALLGMGLLTPQPLLLADEPFDGLDLRQSREVAATLRAHAREGRTIVLSIHQIADAARVCDRFVLLSNGQVCGEGTVGELTGLAAARGDSELASLEDVFLALT